MAQGAFAILAILGGGAAKRQVDADGSLERKEVSYNASRRLTLHAADLHSRPYLK